MTRREAWLSAGGLFALALAVRAVVAGTVPFPTPEDTAYYYGVARNVVEGRASCPTRSGALEPRP